MKIIMYSNIAFCFMFTILSSYSSASSIKDNGPVVKLNNPKGSYVQGHVLKTELGNDIFAFQDIPYAEPPIGERRFQLPVPSKGWQGILTATNTKKICLQKPTDYFQPPISNYTEDCLVLSVYSPSIARHSGEKYPVMIWIHGGGFIAEGGVIYEFNPKYFIDEKIVMVTLNYRLGVMGFLSTGDNVIPANLGLQDQLLAMKWVHENIELFGGDPSNVVIAGESAGAASVSWHLLGSKPSKYYSGAIMQSGSSLCVWAYSIHSYQRATEFVQAIDSSYRPENSTSLLKFLQKASTEDLVKAINNLDYDYVPTIGVGDDFSEPQTEAFDNGHTKQVPALFGFNSEESIIFAPNIDIARYKANEVDRLFKVDEKYNMREEDRGPAYQALKRLYTSGNFVDDLPAYMRYYSDDSFVRPIIRSAQSYSKYVPETYLYQLAYNPSMAPSCEIEGVNGVGHAADLVLLFDQHGMSVNMTDTDRMMSKRIVRIWANFIKYRNPTPFPESLLENITWPRVTPDEMPFLNLTTSLTLSNNPRHCDKWYEVLDQYLQHPITIY